MVLSTFAIALLAVPAISVRIQEAASDEVPPEASAGHASETPESLVAQSQDLIPGIDSTPECCCYASPCTWADEQTYDAKPMYMNLSKFVPHTKEMVHACCKNYSTLQFSACSNGQKAGFIDCLYTDFAVKASTTDTCAEKVSWFFQRDDWYTLLPDWEQHGWFSSVKRSYKAYCPCLASKQSHVNDVVLHKLSYFKSNTWGNPIRIWVMSRPECRDLSQEELQYAIEKSYDKMCKFPMKHAYKPNFQPEEACTYNQTSSLIYMSSAKTCPEGHRCACPVSAKELSANPEKESLLHKLSSGETYVKGLTKITSIGLLSGLGIWMTAWTLPVVIPGTILVVYGGGAAVSKLGLFHNCASKVGCFPMDCSYEKNVGCRINLDIDESDPRNPYWFMPPPMYKCSANRWGSCRIEVCSAEESRRQTVGEGTATYGIWRKKPISVVRNCQPLLARDMDSKELSEFESITGKLRSQEHELARRTHILVGGMQQLCPFLRPSEYSRSARCHDGFTCEVKGLDKANCCLSHGGVQQCPAKYPKLCMDNWCDHAITNCRGTDTNPNRGGLQTCPAEHECQYLLPTAEDDVVECKNGEQVKTSEFNGAWCDGKDGLLKCPWNKPTMCASSDECDGEFCCAKDCSALGGPRKCGGMQQATLDNARAIRNGSLRACQLPWQLLVFVVGIASRLH